MDKMKQSKQMRSELMCLQNVMEHYLGKLVRVKQRGIPGGGWLKGYILQAENKPLSLSSREKLIPDSINLILLTIKGIIDIAAKDLYLDHTSCCTNAEYILFKLELENNKELYQCLIRNENERNQSRSGLRDMF